MAKIKGPLLSDDAHGSISKLLTYSHRKSGKQVRIYNKPLVTPSAKQRGQRRLTEFLVAHWQNMSDADKAAWATKAETSGLNITGYHYFLREAQRDLYTHHGLCGYWHCNEIVDGYVKDISGGALHGLLKPSWPENAPVLADSVNTKLGKALLYDGVDEYVEVPLSNRLVLTKNLTLLCWVRQTKVEALNKGTIGKYNTAGRQSYALRCAHYNAWNLLISVGAVSYRTAPDINLGLGWNLIGGTYDGETALFYRNGVQVASNSDMSGDLDDTPANHVWLGGLEFLGYLGGYVDEVCIYNRLFSPAEMATRYRFAIRGVD